MKKIIVIFGLIISATGVFAQDTAEAIFEKYYSVTGGKQLFDSINAYTIKKSFKNNTASDYDLSVVASLADQSMNKTKTILKRNFIYGINSNDGWLKIPMSSSDKAAKYDTKDLSDNDKTVLRRELNDAILPFQGYEAKDYIASFVADETLLGRPVKHVELSGKTLKYDLFFDSETGLLNRQKLSLGSGEIITQDYTSYTQSPYGISYPSAGTSFSTADKKTFKVSTSMTFNQNFDFTSIQR